MCRERRGERERKRKNKENYGQKLRNLKILYRKFNIQPIIVL